MIHLYHGGKTCFNRISHHLSHALALMTFSLHLLFATIVFLALAERVPALRRRPSRLARPHALTDLALFGLSWLALAPLSLAWVTSATAALHGATHLAAPL